MTDPSASPRPHRQVTRVQGADRAWLSLIACLGVALLPLLPAWLAGAPWRASPWLPWSVALYALLVLVVFALHRSLRGRGPGTTALVPVIDGAVPAKLIEQMPLPTLVVDRQARIVMVNRAYSRDSGWQPSDVAGLPLRQLMTQRQDPVDSDAWWEAARSQGRWQGPVWLRRRDRTALAAWLTLGSECPADPGHGGFIVQMCDISALKSQQDPLRVMGYHDALTGLPTRRLFGRDLARAIERARRHGRTLALLFVNLDRFKLINDSLGRATGDRVLTEMAGRLQRSVRAEDAVARLGGDEFGVLLEDLPGQHDAARMARKIIDRLGERLDIDGSSLCLSASIGIAMYPGGGDDAPQLMHAADRALFRAKRHGRHTFAFFGSAQGPAPDHDDRSTEVQSMGAGSTP